MIKPAKLNAGSVPSYEQDVERTLPAASEHAGYTRHSARQPGRSTDTNHTAAVIVDRSSALSELLRSAIALGDMEDIVAEGSDMSARSAGATSGELPLDGEAPPGRPACIQ